MKELVCAEHTVKIPHNHILTQFCQEHKYIHINKTIRFTCIDIIGENEKKNLLCYLIKEVQLNPHWENKSPLKSIEFNFPIYRNGEEVKQLLCAENPDVETLVVFNRR